MYDFLLTGCRFFLPPPRYRQFPFGPARVASTFQSPFRLPRDGSDEVGDHFSPPWVRPVLSSLDSR